MNRNLFVERIPSGVFFAGPSNRHLPRMDVRETMLSPAMDSSGMSYKSVPLNVFPRFGPASPFTNPNQVRQPSPHPPPPPPPPPQPCQLPISSRPRSPQEEPPPTLCLPLLNVVVDVLVDSTIAHTKLVQSFTNVSEDDIPEARYTFPLYDGSVVTSFRCTIGDVRVLDGQVKPKEEARQDFKKAVEKREAAALLEEHTPEVFETVIGNIPASTVVKIEITYVNELKAVVVDDSKEGLAVIIPMSIAPRYGDPPEGYQKSSDLEDNGLEISIKVNDNGTIDCLAPTSGHAVKVRYIKVQSNEVTRFADLAKGKQKETTAAATQAVASYKSAKSILEEDFVVTIEMQDTSPLRSRAVLSPVNKTGHAALMVNIKPGDVFNNAVRAENFAGEVVFVIDRSASMGWSTKGTNRTKIETLRRAMPLSLTSLPMSCAFNIISFGSQTYGLWETSRAYSQESLSIAKTLASNVQADLGGTDIMPALQAAVDRRLLDRESTQVILITDGEAEPEDIIQFVWKIRQELQDRIRFFALGIGDRISHRLIECIGEFGGGCSEFVDINAKPKWEDRLSRMLRCAMMPNSWTCEINLGPGFERKSLMTYKFCEEPRPEASLVPYIQAPCPTPPLHPFAYRPIFFLLDLGTKSAPKEVTLKTTTAGTKDKMATLKVEPTWTDNSTIHHLATKEALVGLEAKIKQEKPGRAEADLAVQNAESLGVLYSITSKWTSFVAVDRTTKAADEIYVYKADLLEIDIDSALESLQDGPEPTWQGADPMMPQALAYGPLASNIYGNINMGSSAGWLCGTDTYGGSPLWNHSRVCKTMADSTTWESTYPQQTLPLARGLHRAAGPSPDLSSVNSDETMYSTAEQEAPQLTETVVAARRRTLGEEYPDTLSLGVTSGHETVNADDTADSIPWEALVAFQDATGTFQLLEDFQEKLESHFCPGTSTVLDEALFLKDPKIPGLSREKRKILVDTLMVVQYFKTHMTKEQDLWWLMIDKAEYALSRALELFGQQRALASLEDMLESSIMHVHYLPTAEWPSDGAPGPFPASKDRESCEVCGSRSVEPAYLACPMKGCDSSMSEWSDWYALWRHQVESGHVVCREVEASRDKDH